MSDAETTAMRERIVKLETQVGDADGGLRGDIAEIKANQGIIFERIRSSELRGALIQGGGLTLIWLLEHFSGK